MGKFWGFSACLGFLLFKIEGFYVGGGYLGFYHH